MLATAVGMMTPSPALAWPRYANFSCELVEGGMQNWPSEPSWFVGQITNLDTGEIVAENSDWRAPYEWFTIEWTPTSGFVGNVQVKIEVYDMPGGTKLDMLRESNYLDCPAPPPEREFTGDDGGSCQEVWINTHFVSGEGSVYWEGQITYNGQVVANNTGNIEPGQYAFVGWNPDINDVGGNYIDGDFDGFIRIYTEPGGELLFEHNMTEGAHLTCKVEIGLSCEGVTYTWNVEGDPTLLWEQSDGQSDSMTVNESGTKFVAWDPPINGQYGPHDVAASAELRNGDHLLATANAEDTLTCGPAQGSLNVENSCDGAKFFGDSEVATTVDWTLSDGQTGSTQVGPGTFDFTINWDPAINGEYGPHNVSSEASMVVGDQTLTADDSDTLTCGKPPEDHPGGACYGVETSMTWYMDELIITGEGYGNGRAWRVRASGGDQILAEGEGDYAKFEFRIPWNSPGDVKGRYILEFLGADGKWHTQSGCMFKPPLECPPVGPQHVSEGFGKIESKVTAALAATTPLEGFQLVFWADECQVFTCNTLVLGSYATMRGFAPFQIDYKGEKLVAKSSQTLAGEVWEITFRFTWLQDGQDFVLLDMNGNRLRETYGRDSVAKYISGSLTVGLYDIAANGRARWRGPQTVDDWQTFLIKELKLLDNSQDSRDQVAAWVNALNDGGTMSLQSINDFGTQKVNLTSLNLAP
jgi:hypothetical protein